MKKQLIGHQWSGAGNSGIEWSVQTDHLNGRIYIDCPEDDEGPSVFREFGQACILAADEMQGKKKK